MLNMKKLLSILLILTMVLSFIACSDPETGANYTNPNENETTTVSDESAEVTEETEIPDNLPAQNYNGAEVNILVRSEFVYEFKSDGNNADIVDDTVYRRNLDIEERFNVKINIIDVTGTFSTRDTYIKALTSSILADDGAYDLFASAANYILPLVPEGYFINLSDIENIDFSQPW